MLLHFVTTVTLFFPLVTFAQAPALGTAAGYVLFSSNGAVGNTGVSQLTGNIGTNNGAITIYRNVNGVLHNADGASLQAKTDLQLAYNQLNATTSTFFPVSSVLGSGDTLIAGVYELPGVTTLNQELYLNAQGNASAVFIFKIPGAFSTNASSKIRLINGAQACNVFWKVEGLVSMGIATFMRGTVIANNAGINMSLNDTLEGRALSTAGAISVDGVLAYTPTGCGSPVLSGPAAPNLGTTACFAIFSGNGAVANAGITYVTGDVGTNVTSTTGYDALNVTGTIHPIPDGSTSACASDLLTVYNFLNLPGYDIELLYPAQFGNNLVLTPHTYLLNAATTFNGTVFLNAQGNANAVFLIKVNGAFTTSTYSKVILMNGTQAKNVFWKVEGAVAINDYSEFEGTIVANNGAIDLKTGVVLNGRALTTNGAFSTAAITATIPSAVCATLPVSWLHFRGKPVQKNVLLEWATGTEMNNGFFTLERSTDGQKFETITTVNAAAGIVNAERRYSFTDGQPYSLGYYRISQTDKDGRRNYFRTIQVKFNLTSGVQVLYYVQENYIYVQASGAIPGNGLIELYSIDGKKMASKKVVLANDPGTYKIVKPLQTGIYLLTVTGGGQLLYKKKVAL